MWKNVTGALALLAGTVGFSIHKDWQTTTSLVLSGTIEAHEVAVGPLIGGRISEVMSEEGQKVVPGQVLAKLDTKFIDLEIASQAGRVRSAYGRLDLARAGPRREELARAKIEWEEAEQTRTRELSLLKESAISEAGYARSSARAQALRELVSELENGSRSEEIRIAEGEVSAEESRLEFLRAQRDEAMLVAPVEGVIQTMRIRPGWLVPANEALVSIVETGDIWVSTFIPETELGRIGIGDEVTVTVDTFPHTKFRGRVRHVSGEGQFTPRNIQTLEQRSELMFAVRVDLVQAGALKPGMAAFVALEPAP